MDENGKYPLEPADRISTRILRIVKKFYCTFIGTGVLVILLVAWHAAKADESQAALPGGLDIHQYYEFFINQEQLETTNINSRLSWGLTVQGFLFAALALIAREDHTRVVSALRVALPLVGIVTALATLCGTVAGLAALSQLEHDWLTNVPDSLFPRPFASGPAQLLGGIPGVAVPAVILLAWCLIALKLRPTRVQQSAK